ncbi:blue copper protein [Brachypodium distachyon]|uniref:Phytocyanin domain-containing protein n=1 Tax=Brachypodium distachyon TaxID=15368 RepID=I1HSC9_BRADI|nr:blue copper protein [Brachypodium distachyon]KQK10114.1 hypothetical protein BRADI_2g52050v3 [Brachypodium distachyon]|eukprot:XP_003564386.1 blue copper protein [Brachypodium distachyon]
MAEMKAAICCIVAVVSLIHLVTAADHVVGGPTGGWQGGTDYKSWVSAQAFAPGDTLTFKYSSRHNVLEVTSDDYEACSTANPVSYDNSGATTIALASPGKRYFICGGPGHCQAGMKLEVAVAERPAPTTPSPTPQLPPPPQHAELRHAPAPMPLPPAPASSEPPKRAGSPHKKRPKRHYSSPPKPAPALAPAPTPTVQAVEAYFPMAALAPMSSSPPPPPMSSDAAAVSRAKWGEVAVEILALGFVVLAL